MTPFRSIWCWDFEYRSEPGERPDVHCMVARELHSGREVRWWRGEQQPELPLGDDAALFVAFYAPAEIGCHLAPSWPLPRHVLDLYAEHRVATNGRDVASSLLAALEYHGLDRMAAVEKDEMRQLAIRGGPFSAGERAALVDYCAADVITTGQLYQRMSTAIDWPRALLRGRYMATVAQMEHRGVPLDVETLEQLREHREDLLTRIIRRVDARYGVFDGRTFKADRFAAYLGATGIPWPHLERGGLALDETTFRRQAERYPQLEDLRQLRTTLAQVRAESIAVGDDGRNRCMLSPLRTKTGRNAPSNSRFIFGASRWWRALIRPEPGRALAYLDWQQQEIGIAAALSKDEAMMAAYASGDFYLSFARMAGGDPSQRPLFKACALAVMYGMSSRGLAAKIGQPEPYAAELLRLHKATFPRFWRWQQAAINVATLTGRIHASLGWRLHPTADTRVRTLGNWPVQSNGSEMLRLACVMGAERGAALCAPIHDAVLIEASEQQIAAAAETMRGAMVDASATILRGFPLRVDIKVITYPNRLIEPGGRAMWELVSAELQELTHDRRQSLSPAGRDAGGRPLEAHPAAAR